MSARLVLFVVLAVLLGSQAETSTHRSLRPIELPGIHNVVAFRSDLFSGSAPEGDAGFDSLRALGVKTVLSVDGARPDLQRILARGMRSVHIPIGYGGFDAKRQAELVRAVRDLPRPLYLHCHHGKHRSASSAATVAVSLGWLTSSDALARMEVAGTARQYTGLWECAARAVPMSAEAIDGASADFPAVAPPSSFVAAMVAIDATMDDLKLAASHEWMPSGHHTDPAPLPAAATLAEHFRLIDVTTSDAGFDDEEIDEVREWLRQSADSAMNLERLIAREQFAEATTLLSTIGASCTRCHESYRD